MTNCFKNITILKIYCILDFNGDGKPDNITFMIKRIKVHNTNALKDPSYRFPGNYGVEKFLELFSGKFLFLEYFDTNFIILIFRGKLRSILPRLHVHVQRF